MSAKKPSAAASSTTSVQIPQKFHGQLIGSGGAIAKKFQADYNIRLTIPGRDTSSPIVTLSGSGDMTAAIRGLHQLLGFPVKENDVVGTFKLGGIPVNKIGVIMGERAATLRKLEADSGCDITIPQRGAADSDILVVGTPSSVVILKAELAKLLTGVTISWTIVGSTGATTTPTPSIPSPSVETKTTGAPTVAATVATAGGAGANHFKYYVPKRAQFEIIGPGGRIIKGIQEECGVRIKMPKLEDPSTTVVVEGSSDAAEKARKHISKILGFQVGSTPLTTLHLAVNPSQYGHLIGPNGTVVRQIEAKSGCNVYIPRQTDASQLVELEGTEANIASAKAEIESILRVTVKTAQPKAAVAGGAQRKLLHVDFSKPINEALFFPEKDPAEGTCFNRFLGFLASANETIDVCVFTITDGRITQVLRAAQQSGVKVRVITDNDTAADTGSDVEQLQDMKIEVKFDKTEFHMHHKFCVIDSKVVITGSYNWTKSAATTNQENMIITNQPDLVADFKTEFASMWGDSARFTTTRISTRKPGQRD